MKLLRTWTVIFMIIFLWWEKQVHTQEVKPLELRAGIYFDEIGTIFFYPMQWKVVSYINLEPTRDLWKQTKDHQKAVAEYCDKMKNNTWYYLTDCGTFQQYVRSKIHYIDNLKNLIAEYLVDTNKKTTRTKRGVLNFVGDIAKILFGTLSQSDAEKYNSHISDLEKEQIEFLHILKDETTVIKSTLSAVNMTIHKINKNEQVLKDSLKKLTNYTINRVNALEEEIERVNIINEQIRTVYRGLDESQHSFEILIDAFVHAEQGTLQPQLVTVEKIKSIMEAQKLPNGLDFPNFPFYELQKLIVPHTYSYNQYLVYVLEIPLLSPTIYHLYKILPFPVKKDKNTYVFINSNKEYIFSDPVRQHYGKLSTNELTGCFHPDKLQYICQENIPIYTYIPEMDCEATLLHPSTVKMPTNCETRITSLEKTFWIPLYLSNEWLFVAPKQDKITVLCGEKSNQVIIVNEGKLMLKQNCKAFSSYVTLYAITTVTTNVSTDFMPSVPIDFDCCFNIDKISTQDKIRLDVPLVNLMSSADDLRIASIKAEELDKLIKDQEEKDFSKWYVHATAWGSVVGMIIFIILSCCFCFCCCKRCRNFTFWFWDNCLPRKCWKETTDKFCVNIHNYTAHEQVVYSKAPQQQQNSPTTSIRSLPPITEQPQIAITSSQDVVNNENETISQRTRSKSKAFR